MSLPPIGTTGTCVLNHEDAMKLLAELQGKETRTPEQIKKNRKFLKECREICKHFESGA